MTAPLTKLINDHARAERAARHCRDTGQPIPASVSQQLARGEAIYAAAPPNVRAEIDQQLVAARFGVESDLMQQRFQSENREAVANAAFREDQFRRASGGHGETDVRKMAQGEKFLPVNHLSRDKRGLTVKTAETRKPNNDEQRRAQLILAAEKHGFGERLAGDLNGERIAELRKAERNVNPRADNRKVQIMDALDQHDAVAYDAPTPDTNYAPDESARDTVTRSWNDLDTSTPESSQEAQ